MAKLDAARWPELEALSSELLSTPEAARSGRLAELRARDPALAEHLELMLAERSQAAADARDQAAIATWHALGTEPPADGGEQGASTLSVARRLLQHAPETSLLSSAEPEQPGRVLQPAASGVFPGLEGRLLGPYRVSRLLGRGGMGSVWLAERADGLFQRQVALKVMHTSLLETEQRERFARERQIVGALRHPRIAQLLDAGVSADGQPYLALEYVDGRDIARHCDAQRLPLRQRVQLMVQVLEAVQYAHANLVLHRDLKPSNILVTGEQEIRLLDFGIAKLLSDGLARETELTALAGRALTPEFASPEQLSGRPLTTASDVYSLGVVLYLLSCGERPYRLARESRAALEEAILRVDAARPSSALTEASAALRSTTRKKLERELRGDLDTIVLHALHKDPRARYQTVEAFRQDLVSYLSGAPVSARPDGSLYRAGKLLRRHWARVALGLGMLLALLVAAVVSIVQARAAREHQAAAEREARRARVAVEFLLDLFARNSDQQDDPAQARQLTARQLLELGAQEATQRLDTEPELKAELLDQLADMYMQLKLGQQAGELRRAAIDALERAHGPQDPRVATALLMLAEDVAYTERRALGRDALAKARAILDSRADDASEARGMSWLISARINRYDSLPGLLADAEQARRHFSEHPPEQLWSGPFKALELLAIGQQLSGRFAAAEELQRQALAEVQQRTEHVDAWRINPLIRIAESQYARGQLDPAVSSLREALELSRRINGESNGQTLQTQAKLGGVLYGSGQRKEGLELLDATLATLRGGPDTESSGAWSSLRQFRGTALLVEGRIEEAEELWRAEVEALRRVYPDSIPLGRALVQHASALLALGQVEAAAPALEEGCRLWRERSGGVAVDAMANDCWLGQARLALARRAPLEARAWLGQVARLPEPHPLPLDTTEANVLLAWAALQLGEPQAAESAARVALEQLEASGLRERYPALEASARLRLGQALHGARAMVDAVAELTQAVELFRAHGDAHSPWLGEAQLALARLLLDANPSGQQRQQAQALLNGARQIAAAHPALAAQLAPALEEASRR